MKSRFPSVNAAASRLHGASVSPFVFGESKEGMAQLRTSFATPRSLVGLLCVIGLYVIYPVLDIPLLGVSLSFVLYFLLTGEVLRRAGRWRFSHHRVLISLASLVFAVFFVSYVANLDLGPSMSVFDFLLGIRMPYWVLCMVVTAVVVSQTRDPTIYVRVLGVGVMMLGLLRVGAAVFGESWRVAETLGLSQNSYGLLFSTFWPFAMVTALGARRRRSLHWAGALALLLAVMINGSRGSWVTVAITTAAGVILLGAGTRRRILRAVGPAVVVSALLALLFGVIRFLPHDERELLVSRARTFQSLEQDSSYQIRVAMRAKAVSLFREHPVLGVGPGRFQRQYADFHLPDRIRGRSLDVLNTRNAHSAYFGLLAETGLIGALAFGSLLIYLAVGGFRSSRSLARQKQIWGIGVFLGFLGLSIHFIVISGLLGTQPWFIYGLLGGLIAWEARFSRQVVSTDVWSATGAPVSRRIDA